MSPGTDRTPYDTFFRKAFGEPEAARELALNLVPSEYADLLSTAHITVEGNHFVDEALRDRYTDLLIRAVPGGGSWGQHGGRVRDQQGEDPAGKRPAPDEGPPDLLVYFLIEHKSNPDRWVAMQMLRYLVLIWDEERAKHGDSKPLPRIVPVVLYHGTRRWQIPTDFADLVDRTRPGDHYVPRFRPLLANLADLTEEQLIGSLRTITALLFLKYVKRSLHEVGTQMLDLLRSARGDPGSREIYAFGLRTLAAVKEREEMEYLQTLARERRYHSVQEDEMTYAEELLQEGLEKGALADKRAVLIRLVSRRFSLGDAERRRIESCDDPAALDAALDEVVTADSKDAVLAKLP
ncbi:MAG: Rpn family recombination-promoting nuclease/putative transposase [Spirochaetota bacterium]